MRAEGVRPQWDCSIAWSDKSQISLVPVCRHQRLSRSPNVYRTVQVGVPDTSSQLALAPLRILVHWNAGTI